MAKEELIEKICYKGGCNDSIHYREIYRYHDRTFKIDIDTDSSNPSPAYLRILEGTTWNVLYLIPDSLKNVENDIGYRMTPTVALKEFQKDVEELKAKGKQILGY